MTIYPDTNIWNALCDQEVDPSRFGAILVAREAKLALSFHTIYELLKTFRGTNAQAAARAARLFSYLGAHLAGDHITCVHEVLELLGLEMAVVVGRAPAANPFVSKPGLTEMILEVGRLAAGEFSAQADAYLNERLLLSSAARSGQKDHTNARGDMREKLRAIPEEQLKAWLMDSKTTATPTARSLLADKIRYRFSEASLQDSLLYARALLESATLRTAKVLVRADLYFNWRCAHRGSIPKDLYDDMYHVLEAIYCDAYVTKETAQAKYADVLLTRATSAYIYTPEVPIDKWLESLTLERAA